MSKQRDPASPGRTFRDKLQIFRSTPAEKEARFLALADTLLSAITDPTAEDNKAAEVHAVFGYRDQQGDRLVDRFLRAHGHGLTPGEQRVAAAWQRAWYSVFQVYSSSQGAFYEDQYFAGRYLVPTNLVTRQMEPRAVVFCWLIPGEDGIVGEASFVGNPFVLLLHPQPKEMILQALQQSFRRARPADEEEAKERVRQNSFNMHLMPRMLQRLEQQGKMADIAREIPSPFGPS